MLSVVFAAINHALRLPPFSLFLVALMITDGSSFVHFWSVFCSSHFVSYDIGILLQRSRHWYVLCLSLNTAFLRNTPGSWLEIGQTISFFCITSLLALFSGGIVAAGEWVMAGTFTTEHQKAHVE